MISVPAAMLIPLAALFLSGAAACSNVPTMTWSAACLNASSTPSEYNLCQETLQHAPDSAEVTVYALVAAAAAKRSYEATAAEAQSQLTHGSPSGDETAALHHCIYQSSGAVVSMVRVISDLTNCQFKNTVDEYADAADALTSCSSALSAFPSSPVVAMAAASRDMTTVARTLGALVLFVLEGN